MVVFLPGISAQPESMILANDATPTTFVFTNTGFIPLKNANIVLRYCYIDMGVDPVLERPKLNNCKRGDRAKIFPLPPKYVRYDIRKDRPLSLTIQDDLRAKPPLPIQYADIIWIVQYQIWFIPIRQSKEFRFFTSRGQDGRMYWYPQPYE